MKEHNNAFQNADTRPRLQRRTQNICFVISISTVIFEANGHNHIHFRLIQVLNNSIVWHSLTFTSPPSKLEFVYPPCCGVEKQMLIFSSGCMEGNTGQKWNWINLYQTAWCIISCHVVTYPAKQQTSRWTDIPSPIHRVIVSDMPLYRSVCCYIVPGAAKLSSMCGDRVQVIP